VTPDTGHALRSLYEPDGGVRGVFSAKVKDYMASRPDYPNRLFEQLQLIGSLERGATIADIGAGTGLLTKGLLQRGYRVIAVEPNAEMRAAADSLLSSLALYMSAEGSAEHLPLPDSSVDLITAAQAFHWFDVNAARSEFLRVLRPGCSVALIWNDRVLTDPVHVALDGLFNAYGGARRSALVAHESERAGVQQFFGSAKPAEFSWPHEHALDQAGLLSLVFSRSYMPERDSDAGRDASLEVQKLFHRFAIDGLLNIRYSTTAMIGRPQ
jgi:SAM-dependent methyltransferase